ncbi:NAD/FAD-dependent oxidoreductase [Longibacter salinarum]|uniref:NAD/FAD-dependent oxidoreductase n=1 Tax=Longibacter salinarum TaxID=1850348 RepID=A0A2A8D3C0_9BACT|nr:FAD-dependent oxidoreductase [Longibacter salinarum]PEN15128.1 NAD/FAD-dependent oxidoreductase [Longibacter salinarum]
MARLAIIGAGLSGLAAAWRLRTQPIEVTIFEKSRGYSGRAATRGKYGARYDHGANYIAPSSDRIRTLLFDHLPTDDLVQIDGEVWAFDGDGALYEPDDQDISEKWTYARGISTLGKVLARSIPAVKQTETRIDHIVRSDGAWLLTDTDNVRQGPFDAVLLTPPAPQTSTILQTSADTARDDNTRDLLTGLAEAVGSADYIPQFSYIFGYNRRIKRHGNYYGLVNDDESHDISWIGFEHDKPERAADGENVVVVQMSPAWTASRVNADPDRFMSDVKDLASKVLNADLKRPEWYDTQRWRYSMPVSRADVEALEPGKEAGLFFAGDYVAGVGRIGPAIETGLDAGDQIRQALS